MVTHRMGNQHETAKLAYLAGIVDGEGSIQLLRRKNSSKHGYRYGYRVTISNTDLSIIEEVEDTLSEFGIEYRRYSQDRRGKRQTYLTHVMRRESIILMLELITPYLVGKRVRASVLHEALLEWRSLSIEDKSQLFEEFRVINARVPKDL